MHDTELAAEDRAVMRQAALFSGLSESAFGSLLADAAVVRRRRGEVLFRQGEKASGFYVVLDGWVKLYRITAAGDEAVVGVFTKGDSFGEAVCFSNGQYPVNGEVVMECRLLLISARNLTDRIRQAPEIGLAMLASTSQHLHLLVRQIEELKARTGAQRLAEFLLSLAPVQQGPCIIALPYEKALIAGRLGMKPESLSRAFQRIRTVGVRIDQDLARVSDIALLSEFVNQERGIVLKCLAQKACPAQRAGGVSRPQGVSP